MEEELYNLIVKGNDLKPYVRRFQELTVLCPNMVPNNDKLLEAFIGGLPRSIEGNVTASKPQTLEEAINIAQRLMDQVTKHAPMQVSKNSRYAGDLPLCKRCNFHHTGPCTGKCNICNKVGHLSKNCQNKKPATGSNQLPVTVVSEIYPYEEVAQQGHASPPSPAYAPDPIELEDHVPVYVIEPEEDLEEDSEEDPVDYAADAYDDEDEEEESSKDDDDEEEENLAPADSTAAASLVMDHVPSAKETEPFETDESATTAPPPPVYLTTARMSI
ncbi:reverse transcriptase domain-containing protein [Tanacetum coccineum]